MAAKSIPDCARSNGVSRTKIYEQIAQGKLIARKLDGRTIITEEDEQAWLRSLPKVMANAEIDNSAIPAA